MNDTSGNVTRLHLLDFMRGIAALAVVFWHWQHLYPDFGTPEFDRTAQPFYSVLFPLYESGWMAVELFFALSGFVFFWLYRESIQNNKISSLKFFILRFSRLYPLHFITLIVMAIGQCVRSWMGLHPFVYDANNFANFIANILFVQAWSPRAVESFNGPTWSISIEVLLYIFFYIATKFSKDTRLHHFILPAIAGVVLMQVHRTLGRGVSEFFMGGLAWYVWRQLGQHKNQDKISIFCLVLTLSVWGTAVVEAKYQIFAHLISIASIKIGHGFPSVERAGIALSFMFRLFWLPFTVFSFAMFERKYPVSWFANTSWIGDLTYAIYLIHVPLQLAIATIISHDYKIFMSNQKEMLVFYIVSLLFIGMLSYRYVEMPLQKWIRTRWRRA